jgi:glycosyltransferase involved in cell wall biosynthesis
MKQNLMLNACDVTVVIPAYNAHKFITDALNSIATQTFQPREVIVIDDGSKDSTSAVVKAWEIEKNPPFKLQLHRQKNGGIASARNSGIARSSGKWLALLDADDMWEPKHIQQLLEGLSHQPEAILSYSAGRLFKGNEVQELPYDDFWDNPSKNLGTNIPETAFYEIDRTVFSRMMKGLFIKPSSLMFRRSVVSQVGNFNELLGTAEDREFLVRLLLNGKFVYCSTPSALYRWHEDNASHARNSKRNQGFGLQAVHLILTKQLNKLTSDEIENCKNIFNSATFDYLYLCARDGLNSYKQGLNFVYKLIGAKGTWQSIKFKHLAISLTRLLRK